MAIQSRIQSLLRNLFSKRAVERDLEDEVRALKDKIRELKGDPEQSS